MGFIKERAGGAWDVLRGVKHAVTPPHAGASPQRIGSPPGDSDDDLKLISASYEFYRHYTHLEPDRLAIYSDMDEMFQYVLAFAALEAYVEDATVMDPRTGLTIWPKSDNPVVQAELMRLFNNIELEDRLYGDFWGAGKYGDHFGLLFYDTPRGVFDYAPIEPRIVHRRENKRRVLKGFDVGDNTADGTGESGKTKISKWKAWDMVHWRIRGKRTSIDPYGTPFFLSVRLIYKVLKLMEEQMTIYRMNMHPDRLIFKIFTGAMGTEERRRVVRLWRREMERLTSRDHQTGKFTAEYAPWMPTQNIYWPVGQNDNVSGVEKFPGSANAGDIFDVEYMRDLFFAGVRVPKAYMGFEDSQGYRGTDTLSSQSIKFARGVQRLQRAMLQGYTRLCRIHLALKGIDSTMPQNQFTLEMQPVSYLDEAHKAELYAKRFEALDYMLSLGERMSASLQINVKVWATYILKEFGQFDDSMVAKLLTPETDQANLTYEPTAAALRFEKSGQRARRHAVLDETSGRKVFQQDDIRRIRDTIMEDDELREVITHMLPTADLEFSSRYSSMRDVQTLGDLKEQLRRETKFTFSESSVDEALAQSKKARDDADKAARDRLNVSLQAVVDEAKETAAQAT